MPEYLQFASRNEFRIWLVANCVSSDGVWLLFGKVGDPKMLSASDALEEALCYGWIDRQMQRLDEKSYIKYFSIRRENSKWYDKNKDIVEQLEKQGLMTDYGRAKIEESKKNGQWDKPKAAPITEGQIAGLSDLLKDYEPAYTNFQAMSPFVKKTYTKAYLDAKTGAGRASRISWMVERLIKTSSPCNQQNKHMLE
ncbi:YdeI/OmpD-associated family protein [Lachnospiraceae bacterium OttesenSCG-928-D06]|nr:YdeI/OmpD-associated family protein [Lachnospiraceae bacterium OttesenSCG-928-D06]